MCRLLPDRIDGGGALRSRFIIAMALLSSFGTTAAQGAQTSKPNIVVILSDDAGYNELGFSSKLTGQTTQFETPNLDALAQRSVVARQGYASTLCSTTRAGLLTGQYAQRFGFETNLLVQTFEGDTTGFTADNVTIAGQLKDLGYTTGMVGKWHTGYRDGVNLPPDKGFDEFFGLWSGARHYFEDYRYANTIRRGDDAYEAQYRAGGQPYDPAHPDDPNANDSVKGRYVTDAFGDESASYIRSHASDANPFFLYLAFTSPHDPFEAKQQDLNHFANIADSTKRVQAAMNYAMDRNVGKVLAALDDPNNDGDTSDSIRDNSIVVYLNDNGGTISNDNTPLRGSKGQAWEGGIRVPFVISAPGLPAGVYDKPVTYIDLLPTLYAAAGGDVGQLDTDGVDLLPHLSGTATSSPHDVLFWREFTQWAVRKGEWKLTNPNSVVGAVLYNLANDPGETSNVLAQNPEVAEDLVHELTAWEARLDKPRWGTAYVSPYDHFVYRNEFSFNSFTGSTPAWTVAGTQSVSSLFTSDSYANLVVEFPVKVNGSYVANSNLRRLTGYPGLFNQIRLTGNYTSSANYSGQITGNAMILVKNLDGSAPKVRLDATSSGTSSKFLFQISADLQILDDLEITGDGTQNFVISGAIKDFWHPRNVTKTGTSAVTLAGQNAFGGNLSILGGEVKLSGATAAVNGAQQVFIGGAGSLVMDSGLLAVPLLDNSSGGNFQFKGGELRVTDFVGNLTNQGGNFSPGASPAISSISGDFEQLAGKLTIELAGTTPGSGFDVLSVGGSASLDGTLQVNMLNGFLPNPGDSFEFLRATGGIDGTFATTLYPNLTGRSFRLEYGANSIRLLVNAAVNLLAGDYNVDGRVDAADYVVWRNAMGSVFDFVADGDGNGVIDQGDYLVWRANFGRTSASLAGGSAAASVPEPSTIALCLLASLSVIDGIRRRAA